MSNPAQSAIDPAAFSNPNSGSVALARLWRVLVFPAKLFWGLIFCQSLMGSLLVIGWSYRLAQRSAFKYWWRRGPAARGPNPQPFREFLAADPATRRHLHWPNWFCGQNFAERLRREPGAGMGRHIVGVLMALISSLRANFRVGMAGALNTALLTLPACVLWWFGWYDGWNNSFSKGYEQAVVGPLISLFGIAWFITAMFYVPMAQARQAVTGEWRSFYSFRMLLQVVRVRWLSCVGLALVYFLLAIPLTMLKTSPMFWHNPELASLPNAQLLKQLGGYFFWCGLVVLPAFALVRLVAARIYAGALLELIQTGKIEPSSLAKSERDILQRLDLLKAQPQPERHFLVRFVAWSGTRIGRIVGRVALILIWFGFVAQIYISEFFNYHGAIGWLNQPLVQLPCFRYVPTQLKNPFEDIFGGLAAVLLVALIWRVLKAFQGKAAEKAAVTE